MDENELTEQTRRLARSEEKFLSTVKLMIESTNQLTHYLKSNRDHFSTQIHAFDATEELIGKQVEMLREISEGIKILIKTTAETNEGINETNERTKALLAKVESYFGSGPGLDYEN